MASERPGEQLQWSKVALFLSLSFGLALATLIWKSRGPTDAFFGAFVCWLISAAVLYQAKRHRLVFASIALVLAIAGMMMAEVPAH